MERKYSNDSIASIDSAPPLASGGFNIQSAESLNILFAGFLDKRRDGAVRGGWAKRYFVLTHHVLYWFRRVEGVDLLGEERGQVELRHIAHVRLLKSPDAPAKESTAGGAQYIEIVARNRSILLRAESNQNCSEWCKAILDAIKLAASVNFDKSRKPSSNRNLLVQDVGGQRKSSKTHDSPSKPSPTTVNRQEETTSITESESAVVVVSVLERGRHGEETIDRVITRNVRENEKVDLGTLSSGCSVILTLSNGGVAKLAMEELLKSSGTRKTLSCSEPNFKHKVTAAGPVTTSGDGGPAQDMAVVVDSAQWTKKLLLSLSALFLAMSGLSLSVAERSLGYIGLMSLGILIALGNIMTNVGEDKPSAVGGQAAERGISPRGKRQHYSMEFRVHKVWSEKIPEPFQPSEAPAEEEQGTLIEDNKSVTSGSSGWQSLPSVANDEEVPRRFILAEKGDRQKGRQRWEATTKWRKENNVDSILTEPQLKFEVIKRYYPHYFYLRSKQGNPVYIERVGKIDLKSMKEAGVTLSELLRHYVFITEYLWRKLEPKEEGKSVTILDVEGIGMADFGGEVLEFVRAAAGFTGAHYPERCAHIFIVNVPSWFSWIWTAVKPMVDPVTRNKTHILRGKSSVTKALLEQIDSDCLPTLYGGTSNLELGDSPEEVALRTYVQEVIEANKTQSTNSS